MVVHQAVGVADPVITLGNMLEGIEELEPVLVGPEDGLPLVSAGSDVINSAGVFYT